MSEIWDLYDENKNLTGKTHERDKPLNDGEYHLVVEILTINNIKQILVTKRHPNKPYGNLWEFTGGSVISGESSVVGACRELGEETGIIVEVNKLRLINSILLPNRFVDTYIVKKDISSLDLSLQAEEVVDAKFISIDEFEKMCDKGLIIPMISERWNLYRGEVLQLMEHL